MREADDPGDFKTVHVDRVNRFALEFAERAKKRELDHLLLLKPGPLRGEP